MVQPAGGYRPTPLSSDPYLDNAPEALPSAAGRTTSDVAGTEAIVAAGSDADTAVQRRLDAFRDAMTPDYRTATGQGHVSAAFAMSRSTESATVAASSAGTQNTRVVDPRTSTTDRALAEVQSAATAAHVQYALGLIRSGRGTPEQIQAITQALIDAGHGREGKAGDLHSAVRRTMAHYGVGIDCAGYVQQAYLSATGLDRARARFADVEREDLSHLERRGYVRIEDLAEVRAGDLVVLGPQPPIAEDPHPLGHRAIVYDQRLATPADFQLLLQTPRAQPFVMGGPIRVFYVDSSWGNSGIPEAGGVHREPWWYNESTHQWAWLGQGNGSPPRPFYVGSTPYGHACDPPAEGFFRDPRRAS